MGGVQDSITAPPLGSECRNEAKLELKEAVEEWLGRGMNEWRDERMKCTDQNGTKVRDAIFQQTW